MGDELKLDVSSANPKQLFEDLIRDPNKLKNIMQKISKKIETKIKSGEVSKDELMTEAADMFREMKNMPGMQNMMKKMAKTHMGGKGKAPSMDSIEAQLQNNIKASQRRKRMLEKLQQRQGQSTQTNLLEYTDNTVNVEQCTEEDIMK